MMDTRREYANVLACQIVNLLPGDCSKAELYSRVFKLIMGVMILADEECAARWKEPSLN